MNDTKSKLRAFLNEDCEATADEFYDGLYYGRLDLCNKIPCYAEEDPEVKRIRRKVHSTLVEKFGSKEAVRMDHILTSAAVKVAEQEYRWFFKQGVKVGYELYDLIQSSESEKKH